MTAEENKGSQSNEVMEHCKISNSKHQITNKSQIFTLWNPAFGRFARGEIPQGKY
jgi:hypothetical protein